jgi:hypothetical protein
MAREREVKERRARKLEKKHAAASERKARAEGTILASDETYPHGSLAPGWNRGVR